MKVAILDDWFDTLRKLPCFAKLDGHDVTVWTDHVDDPAVLAERLADAEALVLFRERTAITADLLDRLPNLRLISQRSAYPHIDLPACTRNGVLLCSKLGSAEPNYSAAELTWALILASFRQIPAQAASLKAGTWQLAPGRALRGRTIGIYGYGRIGRAVAHHAAVFGMHVTWWASEDGRMRLKADGQTIAPDRHAFFAEPDVVTLHLRLTAETKGIVTAEDLAEMRPDSLLVNTSRAALVAPGALLSALQMGRPGGAALDVFEVEPLTDPHDPLLSLPNVLATPHIGYVTEDEYDLQFSDIFDQINAFAAGQPIHMVNPEVRRG